MRRLLKKLVLSGNESNRRDDSSTIEKRISNIRNIWNNEHQDDVGIEKILRLFLAVSQFFFPGLYIKHYFGKQSEGLKDLMMDLYILLKVFFPLSLLAYQWAPYEYVSIPLIWLFTETMLYVPTLIFASDLFPRPSSYRRSMLLVFVNYFEIVFVYAFIYANGNYLNAPFTNWYDPIYFSFTTLSTIGFGDYYPVTGPGKFLVCTQSLVFLSFVVLFLNFFSSKAEQKGYFQAKSHDE